jgi:hypothetical protein
MTLFRQYSICEVLHGTVELVDSLVEGEIPNVDRATQPD